MIVAQSGFQCCPAILNTYTKKKKAKILRYQNPEAVEDIKRVEHSYFTYNLQHSAKCTSHIGVDQQIEQQQTQKIVNDDTIKVLIKYRSCILDQRRKKNTHAHLDSLYILKNSKRTVRFHSVTVWCSSIF